MDIGVALIGVHVHENDSDGGDSSSADESLLTKQLQSQEFLTDVGL